MILIKCIKKVCLVLTCLAVVNTALCRACRGDVGLASYYSEASCRREGTWAKWKGETASGTKFQDNAMTCAMRNREYGKYYKVTNVDNGKSVVVLHNDYGPNKKCREKGVIIDLSIGAFRKIADTRIGIIKVMIREVDNGTKKR